MLSAFPAASCIIQWVSVVPLGSRQAPARGNDRGIARWGRIAAVACVVLSLALFLSEAVRAAQEVPVDQLLTNVQETLVRVRDASDDASLPPLSKVTLLLKTALVERADGSVSLVVVEFGGTASRETIQEIRLELRPPGRAARVRRRVWAGRPWGEDGAATVIALEASASAGGVGPAATLSGTRTAVVDWYPPSTVRQPQVLTAWRTTQR